MMDLKRGAPGARRECMDGPMSDEQSSGEAAEVGAIVRELEDRHLLKLACEVAERHHMKLAEILGKGRGPAEVRARRELWSLVHKRVPSVGWIGRLFHRDHSTILVGIRKHEKDATIGMRGCRGAGLSSSEGTCQGDGASSGSG